ncbi:hypothetical protein K438DRAFT_1768108 [Mycena galopus ATCC 62051]|nr:hypothetical protein K438DRAFT_1768108 [Mycena galopus ATCC 62051]
MKRLAWVKLAMRGTKKRIHCFGFTTWEREDRVFDAGSTSACAMVLNTSLVIELKVNKGFQPRQCEIAAAVQRHSVAHEYWLLNFKPMALQLPVQKSQVPPGLDFALPLPYLGLNISLLILTHDFTSCRQSNARSTCANLKDQYHHVLWAEIEASRSFSYVIFQFLENTGRYVSALEKKPLMTTYSKLQESRLGT